MTTAVRVLFVCLGNICRSPTAEGVFRQLVQEAGLGNRIEIDSAGTADYHIGGPPDRRACAAALQRGVDLSALRGRQVAGADFVRFDYILAMDRSNLDDLHAITPAGLEDKAQLFMSFAANQDEEEVPDPYYGGPQGFDRVLDMVEDAGRGLLAAIRKRHF